MNDGTTLMPDQHHTPWQQLPLPYPTYATVSDYGKENVCNSYKYS